MTITPTAVKVSLLATDWANSVTRRVAEAGTSAFGYAAFGQRSPTVDSDTGPGFNGQYLERTGTYLLGNGYRGYAPTLRRFNSPDSFSPFGDGGLNSYVYCEGEPVNRRDPSGHLSDSAQFGMLIGAGVLLGVLGGGAAFFSRSARVPGLIAAGTGVTTAAVGTTGLFAKNEGTAFSNSRNELKYIAAGLMGVGLLMAGGSMVIAKAARTASGELPISLVRIPRVQTDVGGRLQRTLVTSTRFRTPTTGPAGRHFNPPGNTNALTAQPLNESMVVQSARNWESPRAQLRRIALPDQQQLFNRSWLWSRSRSGQLNTVVRGISTGPTYR